ncbi:MAG: FAD-binding oxidoreductase, partial [Caldilinea sp.]|nr:FAD-binding oxidoreductase [Caldilinea sp.]
MCHNLEGRRRTRAATSRRTSAVIRFEVREVSNTADVLIIGGGVHGASLAFHLAQRGVKAIVLEKS